MAATRTGRRAANSGMSPTLITASWTCAETTLQILVVERDELEISPCGLRTVSTVAGRNE